MNSLLYYLLQVVIASALLYLYYHVALRNKKFHQYNRFYLLGAVVISILVPFLNIPVYFTPQQTQSSIVLETLTVISYPATEPEPVVIERPAVSEISTPVSPVSSFDPYSLIYYAYILIATIVFIRIMYSLAKINRLKKNNSVEKIDTIFFVNTDEPGTPFSFFRWLFWNRNIELRSEKGEQIFRHELFHIQQKHSLDLLFMELVTMIFWINPIFHLMKKELRAIHEFLADQFAVTKSNKNSWDYAELLLMQALQTKHSLVNPFFHNQIKRRIAMITNTEKTSYRYLRKLLVLPVAVVITTVFAFKYKEVTKKDVPPAEEQITIVIDASHGGIDPGAKSPDGKYTEAGISLLIAKKIKELAPAYNINVVMTREDDVLPGNTTGSPDGNRKRVEITKKADPDAFIAIHVNTGGGAKGNFQQKLSGMEAYISELRDDKGSKNLGSSILQELSSIYKTNMELKKRTHAGIYVLDHNSCPAVILQCGYINNATDLAFITDEANQDMIARSILSAVVKNVENYRRKDDGTAILHTNTPIKFDEDTSVFIRKAAILLPQHKVMIDCDTIISYDNVTNPNVVDDPWKKKYILVDGKHVQFSYLTEKTLTAKEAHMYSSNHAEAIKLFGGKAAAGGVLDLKGVTILSELPPSIYYKRTWDAVEQNQNKSADQYDKVFEKVEIEASFPGGEKAWREFLEKNLDADVPFNNKIKPGTYTVYVQFIVNKEGKASDFKALTAHGYGMEEEVLRTLKKVPKWRPAIQNGKEVNSIRKQPVTFRIISPEEKKAVSMETPAQTNIIPASKNTTTITSKVLDPLKLTLFNAGTDNISKRKIVSMTTPVIPGSKEWQNYLQTRLGGLMISELGLGNDININFAVDENGNITDVMAHNYPSKLVTYCQEVFRSIGKIIVPPDMTKGVTTFYTQRLLFNASPYLSISALKKANPYELAGVDKSIQIISFKFTIDLPDGTIAQVVNTGSELNEEIKKLIREVKGERLITVEEIKVIFGGKERNIASKLFYILSDEEAREGVKAEKALDNEEQAAMLTRRNENAFRYNRTMLIGKP